MNPDSALVVIWIRTDFRVKIKEDFFPHTFRQKIIYPATGYLKGFNGYRISGFLDASKNFRIAGCVEERHGYRISGYLEAFSLDCRMYKKKQCPAMSEYIRYLVLVDFEFKYSFVIFSIHILTKKYENNVK